MKPRAIELKGVQAELRDDRLVLRLSVRNDEDRTLYAYGSVRRIELDRTTGTLRLMLHDRHAIDPIIARHLKEPRFVPLEGQAEGRIELSLPRVAQRMLPVSETGGVPRTERLEIDRATRVEVELGFQDTPFYFNPSGPTMAEQLQRWTGEIVTGTFELAPSGGPYEPERPGGEGEHGHDRPPQGNGTTGRQRPPRQGRGRSRKGKAP